MPADQYPASVQATATSENSPPSQLIAEVDTIWDGITNRPVLPALAVSPPSFLPPQPPQWGAQQETEKALMPCKHCSAAAKALVLYQHSCKAQHHMSCYEQSRLQPNQTLRLKWTQGL